MPAVTSRGARSRRSMNEINMVPFIDVMLVLLIIFMVTAPLITTGVVDLPSVGRAAQQPPVVIEVVVAPGESLRLRTRGKQTSELQTVALAQLAARVKQLQNGDASAPVVITGDRAVKYDDIVQVMDALQKAGIQRVGLSVAQRGN